MSNPPDEQEQARQRAEDEASIQRTVEKSQKAIEEADRDKPDPKK